MTVESRFEDLCHAREGLQGGPQARRASPWYGVRASSKSSVETQRVGRQYPYSSDRPTRYVLAAVIMAVTLKWVMPLSVPI